MERTKVTEFRPKHEREIVKQLIAKHWGSGNYSDQNVVAEFNNAHPGSPIHHRNVRYYRIKTMGLRFYKRRKNGHKRGKYSRRVVRHGIMTTPTPSFARITHKLEELIKEVSDLKSHIASRVTTIE